MARRKLIIFPFNGNGIEALDCLDAGEFEFIGFVDDDRSKSSGDYEIFSREVLQRYQELLVLAVPGSPSSFDKRKDIIGSLGIGAEKFATVIHPTASIGRNVQIGYNCLIMAGVVLTSNAKIHNH